MAWMWVLSVEHAEVWQVSEQVAFGAEPADSLSDLQAASKRHAAALSRNPPIQLPATFGPWPS